MPTRIAKIGREKTIATLAKRIYAIEGSDSAIRQRQAEKALLAANPRLARREGFRSGAAINIPKVAGLDLKSEIEVAKPDGKGIISESNLRLQLMSSRIEDGFRTSLTRKEQAIEKLSDRRFVTQAVKALPGNRRLLTTAADNLKAQTVKDQQEAERFEAILQQAQEKLAALQVIGNRLPRS